MMDTLAFRSVVERWDQAVLTIDLNGAVAGWNPAAERLFGHGAADATGRSLAFLFAPSRREEAEHLLRCIAEGLSVERYHTVALHRDGQAIPVSLAVAPVVLDSGALVGATILVRDIIDLAASEENFRLVVEASPAGVVIVDGAGRITLVNSESERIFGYSRTELLNQPIEVLVPHSRQADHLTTRSAYQRSPEARVMGTGRLVLARRKDGSEAFVEVALSPLVTRGGTLTVAMVVDVSEREALLAKLEAQTIELRRSNEALLQFAYVASHDLQEPLRMVGSYAELLDERCRPQLDERGLKYLGYIGQGARRMQQLVRDLLAYSRLGTQALEQRRVALADVVARVLLDLSLAVAEAGGRVEVGPLPEVVGDESQLGLVFQNLIGNALKFRGAAPPIVTVRAEREGTGHRITIADNGIGMEMRFHDRVFEMFQRLHGRGQYDGSGIGLAIVRRIVERHGGRVWFESEPGRGTQFYVSLPSEQGPEPRN